MQRDEYPYASTYEGGFGASVAYVPATENSRQGLLELAPLYKTLSDGKPFLVLPVPNDREPDSQKQPSPAPFPVPSAQTTRNIATGVGIGAAAYILYKVLVGLATWECLGCGVLVTQ